MQGHQASLEVERWTQPHLPGSVDALVGEAVQSGYEWAAQFHATWEARPFLGPGEALFLTWERGQLVAMAAISADPYVGGAETGRLRFIYVQELARRRGIADRLVATCLAEAAGRWRTLRLHTDNPAAAQLYERYSFRPSAPGPRATHVMTVGVMPD